MKSFTSLPWRVIGLCIQIASAFAMIFCLGNALIISPALADSYDAPGTPGAPYPNMPWIAPIGVRIGKHLEVPKSSKGPAIDTTKGYRIQKLGDAKRDLLEVVVEIVPGDVMEISFNLRGILVTYDMQGQECICHDRRAQAGGGQDSTAMGTVVPPDNNSLEISAKGGAAQIESLTVYEL